MRIGVGKPPSQGAAAPTTCCRGCPLRQRELFDVAVAEAADAVELIVAEGSTRDAAYNAAPTEPPPASASHARRPGQR